MLLSSFNSKPDNSSSILTPPSDTLFVSKLNYPEPLKVDVPKPKNVEKQQTSTTAPRDWRLDPLVAPPGTDNLEPLDSDVPPVGSTTQGTSSGTPTDGPSTPASGDGTVAVATVSGPYIPGALDRQPQFPGGIKKFYERVGSDFNNPAMESAAKIRIMVSFVVEKDGSMTDIKVLNRPGERLETEAIRVLRGIKKKWEPGIKNGQPVRTQYTLPIVIQPE
ncbi:MAG: energy transducer TonB [Proteobacteria bacterium]|nr:MAG: energy transducer TonB [Pseudomonadota bacterium]